MPDFYKAASYTPSPTWEKTLQPRHLEQATTKFPTPHGLQCSLPFAMVSSLTAHAATFAVSTIICSPGSCSKTQRSHWELLREGKYSIHGRFCRHHTTPTEPLQPAGIVHRYHTLQAYTLNCYSKLCWWECFIWVSLSSPNTKPNAKGRWELP